MNNKDFKQLIASRLPTCLEDNKSLFKEMEALRRIFVKDYPISKINTLNIDEYVIGKGNKNRSFCYRVERELDHLGRITGSPSGKFGVWFSKSTKYMFVNKFGNNYVTAFDNIKKEITKLLNAGGQGDYDLMKSNLISPMYKGKLLFLYYPDKYLNIFSQSHLRYFVNKLNLLAVSSSELDLQKAILSFLRSFPELKNLSVHTLGRFLYESFGRPIKGDIGPREMPLPHEADPVFVNELPLSGKTGSGTSGGTSGKGDYDKKNRSNRAIGLRGELIVYSAEKKRLKDAGQLALGKKVDHVSLRDDSLGYDILSFDGDGRERYIEVKSTTAKIADRGFFISNNELEKSQLLKNYYLYLVFDVNDKKPRIFKIKNPDLQHQDSFCLTPIQYHVTLN